MTTMTSSLRYRVVVAGSGMAGLTAAGTLANAGHDVVLVDSDSPDMIGRNRPGVPQGGQLHNLLGRAQVHLESLLPGFLSRLEAAGGVRASIADQTHVFEFGGIMPERPLGRFVWSATRAALEEAAQSASPKPNERVTGRVQGLLGGAQGVSGVSVATEMGDRELHADVVVDALGATSPLARAVLEAHPEAKEKRSSIRQWYTTALVRRPDSWVGASDFWMVFPDLGGSRGGLVSPADESTWRVSLNGQARDTPPVSPRELVEYAASLPDQRIAELLRESPSIGDPRAFGKPVATWRRFDLATYPLIGYIPVGDVVASLNPLFGQGVSGAAWEAAELVRAIESTHDRTELTLAYLSASARIRSAMWQLMTLFSDESSVPWDLEHSEALRLAVANDPEKHRRCVDVWHLLAPVTALLDISEGRTSERGTGGEEWA
jgi:2-polyprenyl-6-methoxyphenol hydroxylase-like FAD-dependent oxidoreductase